MNTGCSAQKEEKSEYVVPPVISGSGGVYLLAEKGTLQISISKRDLNRRNKYQSNLYAYLLTPDRKCVATASLQDDDFPDGNGMGEISRVNLQAEVSEAGIYLLLVEPTDFDGSGHDHAWGFSTNASRYAVIRGEIPTGRGKTPLHLIAEGYPELSFYFQPTLPSFDIRASRLLDASGNIVVHPPDQEPAPLAVGKQARFTAKAGDLWKIALNGLSLELDIEGVTSWKNWGGFGFEDHGFFTFHREAWLPVADWRWILTPYHTIREVKEGGQTGTTALRMHNHSPAATSRFRLELVSPPDAAVRLTLPEQSVSLKPLEDRQFVLDWNAEKPLQKAEEHRLRITSQDVPDYTTYATIRFVPQQPERVLPLPVVYKPFAHLAEQFDYAPDYPLNQVDFSPANQPFIRQTITRDRSDGIHFRDENGWQLDSFVEAIRKVLPGFHRTVLGSTFFSTRTAFDAEGGVYTIVSATESGRASDAVRVLLHQARRGEEFRAYVLDKPATAVADLEGFTGHNPENAPPPIVIYTLTEQTKSDYKVPMRLELIVPEKNPDGSLSLERRMVLSEHSISLCTHSGGASTIVSSGNKIHVVYGEVTDKPKETPGVPTYIVTYHRDSGKLEGPVFLGHAPPVNDMHNSAGIVRDSAGFLHVVLGAHTKNPFQYTRSLKPDSITDGWTAPQKALTTGVKTNGVGPGETGAQTYVGLVCGKDDTLHLAFRQDFADVNGAFPGYRERYRTLSVQRKKPGKPWEEPVPVIIPPLPGYSVYYHKLTTDREGTLFLYLTYRPVHSVYRSENPDTGDYRALLKSSDGGETWSLATESSLHPGSR